MIPRSHPRPVSPASKASCAHPPGHLTLAIRTPRGPLCTALPIATLPTDSPQRFPTARRIRPHLLHDSTPSALPTSLGPALALSPLLLPSRHVALFLPLSHTGLTPVSGTGAVSWAGPSHQPSLLSLTQRPSPNSVHPFLGFALLAALPHSAAVHRVPVLSLHVPSNSPTVVCGLPPVTGNITRSLAPSSPDQA